MTHADFFQIIEQQAQGHHDERGQAIMAKNHDKRLNLNDWSLGEI